MTKWIAGILVIGGLLFLAQKLYHNNDAPQIVVDELSEKKQIAAQTEKRARPREVTAPEESPRVAPVPVGSDSDLIYSQLYDEYLKQAEQGDSVAQYMLSVLLDECAFFERFSREAHAKSYKKALLLGREESFGDPTARQTEEVQLNGWIAQYRDCLSLRDALGLDSLRPLSDQWLKSAAESGFELARLFQFKVKAELPSGDLDQSQLTEYTRLTKSAFYQMQDIEKVSDAVDAKFYHSLGSYFSDTHEHDLNPLENGFGNIHFLLASLGNLHCEMDRNCNTADTVAVLNHFLSPFEIDQIADSTVRIEAIVKSGTWEDLLAETGL